MRKWTTPEKEEMVLIEWVDWDGEEYRLGFLFKGRNGLAQVRKAIIAYVKGEGLELASDEKFFDWFYARDCIPPGHWTKFGLTPITIQKHEVNPRETFYSCMRKVG